MDEDFGYVDGSNRNGSSTASPLPQREPSKTGNSTAELGEDLKMLKHIKSSGRKSPSPSQSSSGNQEGSKTKADGDGQIALPQRFVVKYLGYRETSNLWGIKFTRRPVDEMVSDAKKILSTTPEKALALLKLEVTEEGILVGPMPQNTNPTFPNGKFAIESISYGVQDLVYTRVFAIIVVKADGAGANTKFSELSAKGNEEQKGASGSGGSGGALPFRCHAFVCDSRQTARKLTYSLASAFSKFSKNVAEGKISMPAPKKFAIDLRSPEDIEADLVDSEA